ncbi:uncharacterized protein [Bemisia tabaci]|uniref:uncharacterized protein isoform X2 n=1 Tax=Bemisia tabaci TaxID=7038 RepID=UPI0008F9BD60|nr:PREDICTED: uncharacterized protein LOC109032764 isoform X2 [Bemisia tabaci]
MKTDKSCVALVFILKIAYGYGYSHQYVSDNNYCPSVRGQKYLDLQMVLGLWYAMEIVDHSGGYRKPYESQVYSYQMRHSPKTCPVLHFQSSSDDRVTLIWSDKDDINTYNFIIPNKNLEPGFWTTFESDRDLFMGPDYRITGTAQILRAVRDHMVLTLCFRNSTQMSVLLVREKTHNYFPILSNTLHEFLHRQNLSFTEVKVVCNAGPQLTVPNALLALLLLSFVFFRNFDLSRALKIHH